MRSLVHYGTEKIELNGTEYEFDHFLKLCPEYSVPYGFSTRVYLEGEQHYITDGFNLLHMRKMDEYCNSICDREGELSRLAYRLKAEMAE